MIGQRGGFASGCLPGVSGTTDWPKVGRGLVEEPGGTPMIGATHGDRGDVRGHFLDELRATFAGRGGRPALIYRDRPYAFAELDRRAGRCASWLRGLGVEKGD